VVAEVVYMEIDGFPDYRVGDDGSVWSKRIHDEWTRLNPTAEDSGHLYVSLTADASEGAKKRFVHHLVLEAFVSKRPDGLECLHRNGIPSDNSKSNLRWGTRQENVEDAMRHGTTPAGDSHYQSKLSSQHIHVIRGVRQRNPGKCGVVKFLSRWFDVSYSTISDAVAGRTWRGVK
jgi:hypothetical protein